MSGPADGPFSAATTAALVKLAAAEGLQDPDEVRVLVDSTEPGVEDALMAVLNGAKSPHQAMALASRILVERDPDRHPAFLPWFLFPAESARERHTLLASWLEFFVGELAPAAYEFGYARLRSVDAPAVYTRLARHRTAGVRYGAMLGLGDTADVTALEPVSGGLADRRAKVRAAAADAARRLGHTVGPETVLAQPIRDRLVRGLSDRAAAVRIAAARALGSLGDLEVLRQHRPGTRIDGAELDNILSGRIEPLPKIWPLDLTTG